VHDEVPRPGPGEVRVRVLAAGVSYTDAMLRVGSYLGVPNPPFTPGYELVGVVEELGPGCSRLRVGDRIGSLTVGAGTVYASDRLSLSSRWRRIYGAGFGDQ
jgi:NADPH2:quinone reductase